jgi:hypothetical protein
MVTVSPAPNFGHSRGSTIIFEISLMRSIIIFLSPSKFSVQYYE